MAERTLRVIDVIPGTIVDGPGLRTSIYFAGCKHKCPGCHNPQSWDFSAGKDMSIDEIVEKVEENGFNVTLSGGDPLYQIEPMLTLCERLRSLGYTIWCYTGFVYENLLHDPSLSRILSKVDVIVDGPFKAEFKDIGLRFRGSSNQRLIDTKASSTSGKAIIWSD